MSARTDHDAGIYNGCSAAGVRRVVRSPDDPETSANRQAPMTTPTEIDRGAPVIAHHESTSLRHWTLSGVSTPTSMHG
jgi:hypothetical protein